MSGWASRSENAINAIWRLLLRLALIAAVLYSCYRLRNVITTLFVAAIIAYVLDPAVAWLSRLPGFVRFHAGLAGLFVHFQAWYTQMFLRRRVTAVTRVVMRRHVIRAYATLYVFILAVLLLWQGAELILTPFVAEFKSVTRVDPVTKKSPLQTYTEDALNRYDRVAPEGAKSDQLLSRIQKSSVTDSLQKLAADLSLRVLESLKNIVEIVLLPVLAFYFLIDGRKLKHEFLALLPRARLMETARMLNEFNRIMRAFVAGQFILCLLAGVVVGTGLAALRVPYQFTLGVLAGVTRAIPIIGPIIGGIPIILLTLATKGLGTALAVLGFFTLLHLIESKFIMPMLIGDRMELHPVIIILVLLIGGEVGGLLIGGQIGALLGMFFAAPVASLVRVMIRRYWLQVRTRPRPLVPPPPPVTEAPLLIETPPASLRETLD
jgi:predicted PurR-regulated permease PerM